MNEQIENIEDLDELDDKEEKLFNKEIEKQKSLALEASQVARDGFIAWYQETIGKEIPWNDPVTNWMYNAWVASHGVRKWESPERIAKSKERYARQRETLAKNKALKAEKEKQHG